MSGNELSLMWMNEENIFDQKAVCHGVFYPDTGKGI